MTDTKKPQKKIKTSVLRSHNFQKLYGTNLVGGGTQYDFRFELFNEKIKIDAKKGWSYISDALIILTPTKFVTYNFWKLCVLRTEACIFFCGFFVSVIFITKLSSASDILQSLLL